MNEQLRGVYVYGGGSHNQYVFRAETQRRRRTRNLTVLLAAIFAILIAWCIYAVYHEVAEPAHATANTQTTQVVTSQQEAEAQPAQ